MTPTAEIESLASRLLARGVWVALAYSAGRRVRSVTILGVGRMTPAAAVARMRAALEDRKCKPLVT